MPYSRYGGIFISKRKQFKSSFPLGIRSPLVKVKDYAGHSFRIGAATTAAVAGLEDSAIQTLGKWRALLSKDI